jgi:hypothetical protein
VVRELHLVIVNVQWNISSITHSSFSLIKWISPFESEQKLAPKHRVDRCISYEAGGSDLGNC